MKGKKNSQRLLSLCLKAHQIEQLQEIARKRGVGSLTLVKQWIAAGIAQGRNNKRS